MGPIPSWKHSVNMQALGDGADHAVSWRMSKKPTSQRQAKTTLTKSPLFGRQWWFQWTWGSFLVDTGSRVICIVHDHSGLTKASSAATLLLPTRFCHHVVVAAIVAENATTHSRNDSKPKVLEWLPHRGRTQLMAQTGFVIMVLLLGKAQMPHPRHNLCCSLWCFLRWRKFSWQTEDRNAHSILLP